MNGPRFLALLGVFTAASCSYSPSGVTCETEGATRNGTICRGGVWVNMNGAEPGDGTDGTCADCGPGVVDLEPWEPGVLSPEIVWPILDPTAGELTITFDRPAAEDLEDFVALVDIASPMFVTDDIVFLGANGEVLDHETEAFDATSGRVLAWVALPLLEASGDTKITVRPAQPGDREPDAERVWEDYEAVFHLSDESNATGERDGRDHDSVPAVGQIGEARAFNGVDQWIDTRVTRDLEEWTVSVWVYGDAMPMTSDQVNGPLMRDGNYEIVWDHPDVTFAGAAGVQSDDDLYYASFGLLDGQRWHHLAATFDGEELKSFHNGVMVAVNDVGDDPEAPREPAAIARSIGDEDDPAAFFAGSVDEVRIAETVRSPTWFDASYRNQADPHTFYTTSF